MDYYQAHEIIHRGSADPTISDQLRDALRYVNQMLTDVAHFATHDPGVNWPCEEGEHNDPIDAILAAFDGERETRGQEIAVTPTDHSMLATEHLAKADHWENRDNVAADYRPRIVEWHLRNAEIHATLAVAQQISLVPTP